MLWYNSPESVEAIRNGRLDGRTTYPTTKLQAVRAYGDIN